MGAAVRPPSATRGAGTVECGRGRRRRRYRGVSVHADRTVRAPRGAVGAVPAPRRAGGGAGGRAPLPPARAGSRIGGSDTNTDTLLHIPSDDATSFLEGMESRNFGLDTFVGFPTSLLQSVAEEALECDDKIREVKLRLAAARFEVDDAFIPLSARQRGALYGEEQGEGDAVAIEEDEDEREEEDEEEEGCFQGDITTAEIVEVRGAPCVRNPASVKITLSGLLRPIDIRVDDVALGGGIEVRHAPNSSSHIRRARRARASPPV